MMNKPERNPLVKSGRRTQSTSTSVPKIPTSQKGTGRRGRSLSSSGATESPSSNGATMSRTSSGATMSQLADNVFNNAGSTQKSQTQTNFPTRTSRIQGCARNMPTSQVVSDSVSVTLMEEIFSSSNSELSFIPERRTDKTFIYMYDEKEKKSKEVIVPKDIHVTLPVLVQYEITEDTIRQVTDTAHNGAARTEIEPHLSEKLVVPNARYVTPTPELLCMGKEDEMKNKGARIMQWLLEVQCE